jgi:hypothetical protein
MATFLQTSGAIAMSDINSVFGRGNSLSNYTGTQYYTASGGPYTFPGGPISFNNFYGTGPSSNVSFTVGYTSNFTNGYIVDTVYPTGAPGGAGIRWNANGTMDYYDYSFGYASLGERWGSPATSGIGSGYWIRFTRTGTSGASGANYSTASTGWLQLNSGREVTVYKNPGFSGMGATYTVEISSSSSGSPVLSTRTGIGILMTDSYL